ncbi:MAG: CHAD domain-containing protein [Desulfobacteraceae bacterium]|nr:CHAD domain-containing protein [Desulfobacteraceae bacterium]
MYNRVKFHVPRGDNVHQFMGKLADQFTIKKGSDNTESIRIYDTFDWRLFHKSLVLYESGGRLHLRKLFKSKIMHSIQITSPPTFIWEFPDSALKEKLVPIIDVRALLKLVEVQSRSTPYRILNQDEKTVLQLVYEELRTSHTKDAPVLAAHLWLQPITGYPKYSQKITKRLEEEGLTISNEDDIYFKGLEAADRKPGSYSTKINIQLTPDMRSDNATKVILRFLLHIMRVNEAIIQKDLDTEFVHDFRVAIRRTRSALGQIQYVFPKKTTDRFKKNFAFLGKLSNELRDLDVYLLKEDAYKSKLPPVLRDDIHPLFDYLRRKRSKAFQKFIHGLKSKEYAKILKDWEEFLDKPQQDSATASNAALPVIDLARKRIYKKYKSVVKAGKQILENTDDKMLHVLRIHCKKLRYLMEFFSSLFPSKKMNILIEQLKKLQDNLGDFNDLGVQEKYLLNITEELPVTQGQLKNTLVAIGGLVGTLGRERQAVKDAFAKTFTDFASPANNKLFQDLFASKA